MPDDALTAGVIGGLGPDATVHFMARVLQLTPANTDQDHIRLIVDQNPRVPNRQEAVLGDGGDDAVARCLAGMAAGLERAGADFIVMPCNAAHAFAREIGDAVTVPFVSIVAATIERLPQAARTIGVLETPACRAARLYHDALEAAGTASLALDDRECDELMRLAYAIKRGERGAAMRSGMRALADALVERGANALIAGCTEIPLVIGDSDVAVPLISSTDALALKTIALARGAEPLPSTARR